MTIYSQHANRGKIQILATYEGSAGITSSTVTSLATEDAAGPLVDALNRISALTTVPISVYDRRGDGFDHYPTMHLAALTDRQARSGLRDGTHSLWYEYVCLLLHQALADLDRVTAAVPEPVRTAVKAELEVEERELRDAYAEYSEGIDIPETENRRYWNFGSPIVDATAEAHALSTYVRDRLTHFEEGMTAERRKQAISDLRILADAYAQCSASYIEFDPAALAIFAEPHDDGYFLTIDAPRPHDHRVDFWRIEVAVWEPDDPDDECGDATGKTLISCVQAEPPSAMEISALVELAGDLEKLAEWAKTPAGMALSDTTFTVTERNSD